MNFLHDGIGDSEIQIPEFSITRCDRLSRVGGGVCISQWQPFLLLLYYQVDLSINTIGLHLYSVLYIWTVIHHIQVIIKVPSIYSK